MSAPVPVYGQYHIPTANSCVHFGVGQPAPSLLPLAGLRAASAAKFAEEDPLLLQYGYISGYPLFRAELARFLSSHYALRALGGAAVDGLGGSKRNTMHSTPPRSPPPHAHSR